jgi:hypothetical protein
VLQESRGRFDQSWLVHLLLEMWRNRLQDWAAAERFR